MKPILMACTFLLLLLGMLLSAIQVQAEDKSTKEDRVYEMRTYYAAAGKLDALHARFRDHTCKLFEKHGMTNIAYFVPLKDGDERLIYFLAHKSPEAAKESFDAFRKDPDWVKARKESEEKAGGPLTAKDGVKSIMMKPTDYSPLK